MHYEKSEKLSKLVKDKRVVLVGPAQYLVGKGLGSAISGYDTICTVNYMSPGKFTADYGDRTDIMFYNCSTASIKQMDQHFKDNPEFTKELKLVACPVVKALGPDKWTTWGNNHVSAVVTNFKGINKYNIDFHWIGVKNYRYLFNLMGCREPNSGPLAMMMILEHEPKELFITGFTFYMDSGAYFSGYATQAPGWKGVPGHPQRDQINFFKKHILPKIKIDSHLNKLLKLNHNNVHKL